ncbi:hypothetical protein IHE56_00925 [Streptomyces sp. ID01-12c]|nr:hypothetical protein [Streptomyces caniscabiei]
MKFKITTTVTDGHATPQTDVTGTIHATSAEAASIAAVTELNRHGFQVTNLPKVEEQH